MNAAARDIRSLPLASLCECPLLVLGLAAIGLKLPA